MYKLAICNYITVHFVLCLKLISHAEKVIVCHKCFLSCFKSSGQEADFLTLVRSIVELFKRGSCFRDSICFFFNNDPPVKPKDE